MKKIAIVLDEMSIGGIPKACIPFLKQLVEYYNVTMLMRKTDGELMSQIPKQVRVRTIHHYVFRDALKKMISEKKYHMIFTYVIPYLFWSKICHRWVKANEMTARIMGEYVDGEWDCVIAYHGMSISQLVTTLYSVKAKKKVAWIHGDHPFDGVHKKDAESVYRKFDRIYCVSPSVRIRFLSDFPLTETITDSYKNILESEIIREKSESEKLDFSKDCINLVTVGRVSQEKGQDMIPTVAKNLKEKGLNICWYVVGDGDDMSRIRSLCKENGVQEFVKLVGAKPNPYPYMRQCDIYVQPSYTEGYCLTVCEAAILHKPIVLTAIAAAGILEDGKNALVVEADIEQLTVGIEILVNNKEMQKSFVSELGKEDFSNLDEMKKFHKFIEI